VPSDPTTAAPLVCVECAAESTGNAEGWRAYVAFLEEDGEPPEVVLYCPRCAEFEFG
jgi:hypothetical protein